MESVTVCKIDWFVFRFLGDVTWFCATSEPKVMGMRRFLFENDDSFKVLHPPSAKP
jgi:hypothetical protein